MLNQEIVHVRFISASN